MNVEQNTIVQFSYEISDSDGAVLAKADPNEPATYIHGYGLILPKLEAALAGKAAGDSFKVQVSKEEGYGDYEKDLVFEVDKAIFHADNLSAGMEFEDARSGNSVKILEIRGDKVLVDANHPYAGKDLVFSVKVEKVEAAKPEDIQALQESLSHHSQGCGCGCHGGDCGGCGDTSEPCGCGCGDDAEGDCGCGCGGGCC